MVLRMLLPRESNPLETVAGVPKMLKKLFLRRSKEILNEVETAESTLKSAQEKIDKLKTKDSFKLIKCELVSLINQHGYLRYNHGFHQSFGSGSLLINNDREREITREIEECLVELELMVKNK